MLRPRLSGTLADYAIQNGQSSLININRNDLDELNGGVSKSMDYQWRKSLYEIGELKRDSIFRAARSLSFRPDSMQDGNINMETDILNFNYGNEGVDIEMFDGLIKNENDESSKDSDGGSDKNKKDTDPKKDKDEDTPAMKTVEAVEQKLRNLKK